jgi:hypothetical protein
MIRRRRLADPGGSRPADPYGVLGLQRAAELTDDDVRAAWRAVAAATHPDRADGGDPARFATAAGAYAALRTAASRAEALATPVPPAGRPAAAGTVAWRSGLRGARARIPGGRPGRLALRVLTVVAVAALAVAAVGWQPASLGVITGALTWLAVTGRADIAGPRG